jgi:hypothetical protein
VLRFVLVEPKRSLDGTEVEEVEVEEVEEAKRGLQLNLVISDRDISEFCLFRPSLAEPEKICSIYRNLSVLAISDCFTDFLVYSDIQKVTIFIGNSFIFGRNMPLPTEEQRIAIAVAQAN